MPATDGTAAAGACADRGARLVVLRDGRSVAGQVLLDPRARRKPVLRGLERARGAPRREVVGPLRASRGALDEGPRSEPGVRKAPLRGDARGREEKLSQLGLVRDGKKAVGEELVQLLPGTSAATAAQAASERICGISGFFWKSARAPLHQAVHVGDAAGPRPCSTCRERSALRRPCRVPFRAMVDGV